MTEKTPTKAELQERIEALKGIVAGEELPKIKAAVQRLEGSAYRIADALYSQDSADKKSSAGAKP